MTQPQNPQQPSGVPNTAQQAGMAHGAPLPPSSQPLSQTSQTTTTQATTPVPGQNGIPPINPTPSTPAKKVNPLLKYGLPILLVIGGAILATLLTRGLGGASFMKQGECVTVTGNTWKKAECGASGLTYKVTKVGDGITPQCASDAYMEFTSQKRVRRSQINKYACLMPNFKENTCYVKSGDDLAEGACGSPQSFKIVKKMGGGSASCAAPTKPLHYPDENVTFCAGQ